MTAMSTALYEATSDGTSEYLAQHARSLLERARAIDLRPFEELPHPQAIEALARGPATQIMMLASAAVRLLVSLPDMLGATAAVSSDGDLELDFGGDDPEVASEGLHAAIDAALAGLTTTGLDTTSTLTEIEGTCSMLALELRQCRNRLQEARWHRSKWTMLAECETVRRKAQRAGRLVLSILDYAAGAPSWVSPRDRRELELALSTRRVLFNFRADVLGLTEAVSAAGASECIVALHRRVSALVKNPLFKSLRASDRYQVYQLEHRLEERLVSSGETRACLELISDVTAFVQLLCEVNRRECLVRHDDELRQRCLDQLRALETTAPLLGRAAFAQLATVLGDIDELRYRSPALAALAIHRLATPPRDVPELLVAVYEVLAELDPLRVS